MIPVLPEMPLASGPPIAGGGPALPQPGGGVTLDFAGLLNAAMPKPITLTAAEPDAPDPTMFPTPATATAPTSPAAPSPRGKVLPDNGIALPEEAVPAAVPSGSPGKAQGAQANAKPSVPESPDNQPDAPAADETTPPPAAIALAPVPAPIVAAVTLTTKPPAPVPAPAHTQAQAPARAATRTPLPTAAPLPDSTEQTTVPSDAATALDEPSAPVSGGASGTTSGNAPAQQATTANANAVASVPFAATPVAGERAEPRAPAPQQESTIAQVGELREALRAARPEMTLRHAEFGFVSLRIEATGTQDWRAVLASRDPGFVPAIQAALAERAISATHDTASANTGQHAGGQSGAGQSGAGQNGGGDQRYGASPNGGQGSSQPYLAHSSDRDGSSQQHSQQRQHGAANGVAERAGEGDADPADLRGRGVFA